MRRTREGVPDLSVGWASSSSSKHSFLHRRKSIKLFRTGFLKSSMEIFSLKTCYSNGFSLIFSSYCSCCFFRKNIYILPPPSNRSRSVFLLNQWENIQCIYKGIKPFIIKSLMKKDSGKHLYFRIIKGLKIMTRSFKDLIKINPGEKNKVRKLKIQNLKELTLLSKRDKINVSVLREVSKVRINRKTRYICKCVGPRPTSVLDARGRG